MTSTLSLLWHLPELSFRKAWDRKRLSWFYGRNGHPGFLHEVTLLLTFRCQLRCVMCPEWGEQGIFKGKERELKEELALADWLDFAGQLKRFKPALSVLGGGEPLLFKGWQKLAKALHAFTRVMVITNGLELESWAKTIVDQVDILHVSIDGDRKNHDRIRGKGSFDRAMRGLEVIGRMRSFAATPRLRLATTVVPGFTSGYRELLEEAFARGADDVIIQHLMFIPKEELERLEKEAMFDPHFWRGYALTLQNTDATIADLRSLQSWLKTQSFRNRVQFHPPLSSAEIGEFYKASFRPLQRFSRSCLGPYLQMIVLPQGEVWLCPGFSVGNLKEKSLEGILKGEKAARLYGKLKSDFPFSVCASCCYLYSYAG